MPWPREPLALVKAYADDWPGFKVPEVLVKQAESGQPWPIPMVYRKDEGEIAVVTIRRPAALNALNQAIMGQLKSTFEDIKGDDRIKGVVLTGFGVKAFVSGADINEIAMMRSPEELRDFASRGHAVLSFIENLGKPVVCAMNGLAFGGGNELAMACTARIALKGTKVLAGQPEPKLGIIPGYGGTQRMPRWIGLAEAWPLLRTGNPTINNHAAEAHNILGIIHAYQGKNEEAQSYFLRALEVNPDFVYAHYNLGILYFSRNLPNKAVYHLKKIIEGNPFSEFGLLILAKIFKNQKMCSIPTQRRQF